MRFLFTHALFDIFTLIFGQIGIYIDIYISIHSVSCIRELITRRFNVLSISRPVFVAAPMAQVGKKLPP